MDNIYQSIEYILSTKYNTSNTNIPKYIYEYTYPIHYRLQYEELLNNYRLNNCNSWVMSIKYICNYIMEKYTYGSQIPWYILVDKIRPLNWRLLTFENKNNLDFMKIFYEYIDWEIIVDNLMVMTKYINSYHTDNNSIKIDNIINFIKNDIRIECFVKKNILNKFNRICYNYITFNNIKIDNDYISDNDLDHLYREFETEILIMCCDNVNNNQFYSISDNM